jgi:hypothetical protein
MQHGAAAIMDDETVESDVATPDARRRESDCVQLTWSEEDGLITVTPRNKDRFNIRLKRAIIALQQADRHDQFEQQLQLLHTTVVSWLKDRSDILSAHLTLREGNLSLVVVKKEARYDAQFEDELSELDYRIANDVDLDLIRLDAIALPPASEEALETFFDPNFILTYALRERSKSPATGE